MANPIVHQTDSLTLPEIREIQLSEVVYRDDLYPRIKPDSATIQRYAENLDVLPPIEVNQHGILIDGFHRWTAHRKQEAASIRAIITQTQSEAEVYALAIRRNSAHGLQMNDADKKKSAIRLYAAGAGLSKQDIADTLSVTLRSVTGYLSDIDKQLREERKQRIFDLWMACFTAEEIAELVNLSDEAVRKEVSQYSEGLPKVGKVLADFADEDFSPPLYNVWTFAKKTNAVKHFGNSEQRILENLLYLYTQPFDIVLDPFAGGGATIDVCQHRMRRYWVSDRKPIVERENEIRLLDIAEELPPLNRRWSEVTLTYLDPPYWRQAENQYSTDAEDLANMPLEQFTDSLIKVVNGIASKQTRGAIALLIQPTQWKADNREFTDHIMHLVSGVNGKRLRLANRVSCPYSTEQCTPQQVEWAKANKQMLVISRELIIWEVR
jgi:DNA-binding CsgD family transcriptional regulator